MLNNLKSFIAARYTFKSALLIFVLFLLVSLIIVYSTLGFILEWSVGRMAKGQGILNFKMDVVQVDPWVTKIKNLKGLNEVTIDEIEARYDPATLAIGKINSLSVSGVSAKVELESQNEEDNKSNISHEQVYELLNKFLIDSPVEYFRLRDSVLKFHEHKLDTQINLMKIDFFENQILLDLDLVINNLNSFLKLSVSREGDDNFLSSHFRIGDAVAIFNEGLENKFLKDFIPQDFSVSDGNVEFDTYSRITQDGLNDVFFELNATDLEFSFLDNNFSIPKLITFFDWEDLSDWKSNTYLNFTYQNDLIANGVRVLAYPEDNKIVIGGEVSELIASQNYNDLYIQGMRVPELPFNSTDTFQFPLYEAKRFSFDEFHYGDNFFRIYNGAVDLTFISQDKFKVSVPTLSANLLNLGISFNEFSYNGIIDLNNFPAIESPQTISGLELNLADQDKLTNLALTFRTKDTNHIFIDLLNFAYNGTNFNFEPANFVLKYPKEQPDLMSIELNKATFSLPELDILFTGIKGTISLKSLSPFETNGTQMLTFDECKFRDFTLSDGNFSFEIKSDGSFVIKDSDSRLHGGILGLYESSFGMSDDLTLITKIEEMDGQKIIDLFDELDAEIKGNFSGKIPISKKNGKWNLEEGYIELDTDENRTLRYNAKGLLTKDLAVGTEEYKRMKMAEDALSNLNLQFLKISIVVEGESRKIKGSIIGESILDDGTKILLDYRPNTVAGLDELIEYINK